MQSRDQFRSLLWRWTLLPGLHKFDLAELANCSHAVLTGLFVKILKLDGREGDIAVALEGTIGLQRGQEVPSGLVVELAAMLRLHARDDIRSCVHLQSQVWLGRLSDGE